MTMLDMNYDGVSGRLRRARLRAGYSTAMAFAESIGVNPTTYHHHEMGRRSVTLPSARLYAQHLKLAPSSLIFGEHLQLTVPIPIVGTLGASGKVTPVTTEAGKQRRTVSPPDMRDMVGTEMEGEDVYSIYRQGDVIFHRPLRPECFTRDDLERLHGLECIVQVRDGATVVRKVSVQSNGLATLIAYNAAPPMLDQPIAAGAPVEIVLRSIPPDLQYP